MRGEKINGKRLYDGIRTHNRSFHSRDNNTNDNGHDHNKQECPGDTTSQDYH